MSASGNRSKYSVGSAGRRAGRQCTRGRVRRQTDAKEGFRRCDGARGGSAGNEGRGAVDGNCKRLKQQQQARRWSSPHSPPPLRCSCRALLTIDPHGVHVAQAEVQPEICERAGQVHLRAGQHEAHHQQRQQQRQLRRSQKWRAAAALAAVAMAAASNPNRAHHSQAPQIVPGRRLPGQSQCGHKAHVCPGPTSTALGRPRTHLLPPHFVEGCRAPAKVCRAQPSVCCIGVVHCKHVQAALRKGLQKGGGGGARVGQVEGVPVVPAA